MIYSYDFILSGEECNEFIDFFENSDKQESGFASENDPGIEYRSDDIINSIDIHLGEHEEWYDLNNKLHDKLEYVVTDYLDNFKGVILNECYFYEENCIMSRYDKNKGFFNLHQDGAVTGYQRSLTVITYLNDVEEGGETEFINQDVKVKPKKGSVCIFPSNFIFAHKGNKPISNDKYILVSFVKVSIGDPEVWKKLKGEF